jgi:ABC-type dipeptide/oligopeptide/nickel transport system permease subunit
MNRAAKILAFAALATVMIAGVFASRIAPAGYEVQDRENIATPPSAHNLLGTDSLGRDRFSRLVYAVRITVVFAPAAALLATALAGLLGGIAGFFGGFADRLITALTDLFLALPWIFLLLLVRSLLPLNIDPIQSVAITFAMLGLLGWATSARIVRNGVKKLKSSDFVMHAVASGCGRGRILVRHVLPNVRPILLAQFWIALPVFVLTEANLSMLGLGVAEPVPSLGGMIRELQPYGSDFTKLWLLAPLLLLIVVVSCLQVISSAEEFGR